MKFIDKVSVSILCQRPERLMMETLSLWELRAVHIQTALFWRSNGDEITGTTRTGVSLLKDRSNTIHIELLSQMQQFDKAQYRQKQIISRRQTLNVADRMNAEEVSSQYRESERDRTDHLSDCDGTDHKAALDEMTWCHAGQNDYQNNSKIILICNFHKQNVTGKIKMLSDW